MSNPAAGALRKVVLLLAILAFVACASPPWQGMSETEIAAWKGIGFNAEMAEAWHQKGFSVEDAGAWGSQSFSADDAARWRGKSFTPEQAKAWRTAGMNLEESVENREKGLMPIAGETPKSDTATPEDDAAETTEAATEAATEEGDK